ncbi:FliH/SctL family protein [Sphingomonas sp.]|uniref:FliH/SctL family protein n=1 Tax=Sphingomonas sp. TaxID=28214 RepID=UPI003B00E639
MSERFAAAERISIWTKPPRPEGPMPFVAWGQALRQAFEPPRDEFPIPEELTVDPDAVREESMAEGFAAGLAAGRAEADAEREALHRLAAGLGALRPEPTRALGGMIAMTVERLLTELMGTVEIDRDLLLARATAAAELIGEETRPACLKLHPHDLARLEGAALPLPAHADPTLPPGGVRVETGQGWIEDTPAMRLETLRAALDRVTAAR